MRIKLLKNQPIRNVARNEHRPMSRVTNQCGRDLFENLGVNSIRNDFSVMYSIE